MRNGISTPAPIDEAACKLHRRIFQHIWLGQMDALELTEKERQYLGQTDDGESITKNYLDS